MAARVNLWIGPAGCGKTTDLLLNYRRQLLKAEYGSTLWLSPTHRSAADVRQRLLDSTLAACFSPGVMTFERFADAVVEAAESETHHLGGLLKRQLLRHIVDAAQARKSLEHFGPIAHTRGFVDLVADLISELKRVEIWPEDLQRASGGKSVRPKDREILSLYGEYQRLLTAHDLYDAEGRFWSARALIREGQRRPFEQLRWVVVDGFTDFTRTQHEILALLATWVDEIHISLPGEESPVREDLFAKTRGTLKLLRQYHSDVQVSFHARQGAAQATSLAALERNLFGDPRRQPAADGRDVSVLVASGERGEFSLLGQRIKRLLVEGDGGRTVRPRDVAVVLRSAADSATLVGEVFTELGIPHVVEAGPKLSDSPAVRALLAFLRLDQEDWPFRSLIAAVANNYFRPDWPEYLAGSGASAAEWAIRNLQISSSRQRLLELLERRRQVDATQLEQSDATTRDRLEREAATYGQAADLLGRMAAAFDALPRSATASEWATALRSFVSQIGLAAVADTPAPGYVGLSDALALDQLMRAAAAGDGLAERLGEPPGQLDRNELYELLLDVVRWEPVATGTDEVGRVRILSANSARALSVPYLFVAGLTERSYPSPAREDRLYSEAEYQRLHDAGLPVVLRAERTAEEMLLFYEVVTRATRHLTFSYPGWDDKAESLLPSPFLAELDRIFGDSVERVVDQSLSPIPGDDQLGSTAQWRVRAVHDVLHEQPHALNQLLSDSAQRSTSDNLAAALRLTQNRRSRQTWSTFEGLFESDAARQWLAKRFGESYTWTVSHLEQYATCPYQFFLQRLAGLAPLGQLSLEEDYGQRGWMIHETLSRLHRALRDTTETSGSADAITERFLVTLGELLQALPGEGLPGGLHQIDRQLIEPLAQRYGKQLEKYLAACREQSAIEPGHFEVSFGLEKTSDDPLSTPAPLTLQIEDQVLRFAGRIDRIDLGRLGDRTVFNVIDYKSGTAATLKEGEVVGTALQLDLYAMAVEELLLAQQQATPWQIGYWRVRDQGYHRPLSMVETEDERVGIGTNEAWSRRRDAVLQTVAALVRGIRAGEFPMHNEDHDCTGHCHFRTVCRVNQVRALDKTWPADEASR